MKIIGLTGGIGSGKSTVSDYLSQKGYPIIDADKIARQIVAPDSETLFKLVECFGNSILNQDGTLNRKGLALTAFSNKEQKQKLDSIMLSEIVRIISDNIEKYEKQGEKLIFIDAPLLFETGLDKKSNEIWVVDAEDEVRIQRVIKRDGSSREEILLRIENQMSRQEQHDKADYILNNSTTQEALYEQVDKLLKS
ncbi:dephospho-CoA kinase [Aminipila terrae]|uniref:Dephospho-CoA kinase n=1 Tax=Aminipila terrae TaxID=2697030 RepID=A0A6P1MIE7_9FIRM|nr:dephospho-CoA kinase [Aminipila terrae]QHI73677.1 dephospho-CoA kinase [Aminipila terrae]